MMLAELSSMVTDASFWKIVAVGLAVAYGMIPVAIIFESRFPGRGPKNLPFWKGQSKAYLPGVIGLVFMVATCLFYRREAELPSWVELVIGALSVVIGFGVFRFTRCALYTKEDYGRSWISPTKLYHDFVMLLLFTSVLAYVCLPVWVAVISDQPDWRGPVLLGIAVAVVLWGGGMAVDLIWPEKIDKERQHPKEWLAIWQH